MKTKRTYDSQCTSTSSTDVRLGLWMASERETAVKGPSHYNFRSLLNSREVWFGESHHQMLLGGLKNVQNDEVYQIFAWVNLGWHQRRKETWLLFRLFRAANLTSGRSMCPCVAYRSPGILCAYSMRKRIWNLMVKQSRSDSCNLPPKPFQTCLTRDFWSRAELWHCFRKGGWGKGGASSWWMSVQTSLSQPPKNCLSPIRSGHKDERINRRKLTSDLVQLEFCF